MKTSQITVTDARLNRALRSTVDNVFGATVDAKLSKLSNDLSIVSGTVTCFFYGLNKVNVKLDTGEVITAHLNYPFVSKNLKISYLPDGEKVTSNTGQVYIKPFNPVYCDVLQCLGETDKRDYTVIGFHDNNYNTLANNAQPGEICLSVGDTSIVIHKDYIHLQSEKILFNSVDQEEPAFLDDYEKKKTEKEYYTKSEVDMLIQQLIKEHYDKCDKNG